MARDIRIVAYGTKPADQFQAHPNNPRKHPKRQRELVKRSLDDLGWYDVVIENVRTGNLIDGHERIWQALDTGDDVPFVQVDLSEEEEKLALASHDWLSSLAEFDRASLDDLLHSIDDGGKLLEELAADFRFADLMPAPPEDPGPQIDRAEELREKWGTARGQVWRVGEHRVMCGDSTSADIDCNWVLVTDPPYGINFDSDALSDVGKYRVNSSAVVRGDDGSLDLSFLWTFNRRIVWGFPYIYDKDATGWIVWDKQPAIEKRMIVTPIEMASTTMRTGFDIVRVLWMGYYREAGEQRQPHPTQKPVGVIAPFIEAWVKPNDTVYDPFLGSGTTLVACQQTGRRGYGMEIDPAYVAVTLERLAGMGLEPKLLQVEQA